MGKRKGSAGWAAVGIFCALFLVIVLSAVPRSSAQRPEAYDLIIRNGRVLDGSGNPWFRTDIGIRDGRIAALGDLSEARAGKTIDAENLFVTPGFIDMHTHCDRGFDDQSLRPNEPWIRMGVTTILVGVDGNGSWEPQKVAAPWLQTGIGTNVAFYVGHNLIRRTVMGIDDRAPTAAELQKMKDYIRQGMENGAFGISTGLEYIPGIYSKTDEVIELSQVAAQYGGIYDSHYRDEFDGFLESVDEGIEISEKAGLPVHLGHFKIIGKHNWWMMSEGLRRLREARARGVDITLDQYPWNNGATSNLERLIQVPPGMGRLRELYEQMRTRGGGPRPNLFEDFRAELAKSLKDPAQRALLRAATEEGLEGPAEANWIHRWGYDWMRVVRSKKHHDYVGQLISEIAGWRASSGFEVVADLIVDEGSDVGVSIGPMLEENVTMAMKEPYLSFSSDGSLGPFGVGYPHPRSYGSFTRVFRKYVREEHVITMEDAVRKMTSLSAQILGLTDRGRIAAGYWADITIFDPETIADKATFPEPSQYSAGVDTVIVNGKPVLEKGKMTGALPGKMLVRQRSGHASAPK